MVLPVGKLPLPLLEALLSRLESPDPRVVLGPGIGMDCAVVEAGEQLLVLTSDPITFATERIGWYAVQVCANDIATCGAAPRWFLVTLLLPAGRATAELAMTIASDIHQACAKLGILVVGGHTEITSGLPRPIVMGTLIGEVPRERLVTPRGASSGDRILLTKSVPIEATAVLAREFSQRLADHLTPEEIQQARTYLDDPGISVVEDAHLATQAGRVSAMHDPTEGGLAAALWELASASDRALHINLESIPISPLSRRICQAFGLDPLATLASGALLVCAPPDQTQAIQQALADANIPCCEIGRVEKGPPAVWLHTKQGRRSLPLPARDEIARLFEG